MNKVKAPQTFHLRSACVCTLGHFVGIELSFEGVVEIANAACTPVRPSSLQLDVACIPSVNKAEW